MIRLSKQRAHCCTFSTSYDCRAYILRLQLLNIRALSDRLGLLNLCKKLQKSRVLRTALLGGNVEHMIWWESLTGRSVLPKII